MKKYLAALIAVFLCTGTVLAKVLNLSCPTNSTTCTVISGLSTKGISITQLLFSLSTSDQITLNCGGNAILGPIYFGASSGLLQNVKIQNRVDEMVCGPNNDLTITKGTSTTPVTIWLDYDQ